jgi:hypothetical protein
LESGFCPIKKFYIGFTPTEFNFVHLVRELVIFFYFIDYIDFVDDFVEINSCDLGRVCSPLTISILSALAQISITLRELTLYGSRTEYSPLLFYCKNRQTVFLMDFMD